MRLARCGHVQATSRAGWPCWRRQATRIIIQKAEITADWLATTATPTAAAADRSTTKELMRDKFVYFYRKYERAENRERFTSRVACKIV